MGLERNRALRIARLGWETVIQTFTVNDQRDYDEPLKMLASEQKERRVPVWRCPNRIHFQLFGKN